MGDLVKKLSRPKNKRKSKWKIGRKEDWRRLRVLRRNNEIIPKLVLPLEDKIDE